MRLPSGNTPIFVFDGVIRFEHHFTSCGIQAVLEHFESRDEKIMQVDWKACGYLTCNTARGAFNGALSRHNRKMSVHMRDDALYIVKDSV